MDDLSRKKGFIFDLDGVIYVGKTRVEGAAEAVACLRKTARKVRFITNDSSYELEGYVSRLKRMGVECSKEEIITSGEGAAIYLMNKYRKGKCFVVGEKG